MPIQSAHGRGGAFGHTPHNKKYPSPTIQIPCHICSRKFDIATKQYYYRLREGKARFACSKRCTRKLQSLTIREIRSTLESRAKTTAQLKRQWKDPALRRNHSQRMRNMPDSWHSRRLAKTLKACLKSPTKPERQVIDFIKQHHLPFRYVGNGRFWIGKLNPDFVSTDDSRRVIDVNGCYWHGCWRCFPGTKAKGIPLNQRLSTYRKHGYEPIIVWQHELDNTQVLEKLILPARPKAPIFLSS